MNLAKILGLFAVGGLLLVAAPGQKAEAASPMTPGVASTMQDSAGLATNVQHRRHHRHYHHRHYRRHHHWRPHYWHPRPHHWHRPHYYRHHHHHHRRHWR